MGEPATKYIATIGDYNAPGEPHLMRAETETPHAAIQWVEAHRMPRDWARIVSDPPGFRCVL